MARSNEAQRWLDRNLGIALLRTLSLVRKSRPRPAIIRRIGFVEPTAIGDLVLDTGLLAAARAAFPDAELHLFHGAGNGALVPLLPVEVIAHRCDFGRPHAALRDIRAAKLDILVDCTSWPRLTALLAALSGVHTIGFSTPGQSRHHAYDATVPHRLDCHEGENRAALATALTGHASIPLPALVAPEATLPDLPHDRLVLCHVAPGGSRAQEKCWPPQQWAALAQKLAAEGWVLGFTGVQQDQAPIRDILERAQLDARQAFSLAGKLNMAQLAQLLQRAQLLITVDTATVHLGSALNIPMVALHGPSPARRWGATSPRAVSLDAPHAAAGFIHFGYEAHAQALEIMPTITVTQVHAAARQALAARHPA